MILLNGCSYGKAWLSFPGINLSISGGSFDRSIRTTVEYIATNPKPDAVLIPITFVERSEFIVHPENDNPIEGPYTSSAWDPELKKLQFDYCDIANTSNDFMDKFFVKLITFKGWLQSQNIPYLFWNSCNLFEDFKKEVYNSKSIKKIKLIEDDPGVINLFEFTSNLYLYNNQGSYDSNDSNIIPEYRHYENSAYEKILKPYLQNYIKEKNLRIKL